MKIVPNTDTYQYTNLNPRGWHVGDCVVRALAYVIDKPYDQILRELTELAIKRSAGCPALPEGRRAGKTLANILRLFLNPMNQ